MRLQRQQLLHLGNAHKAGATLVKGGVKGGVLRRSPEGFFGRNRRIWLETSQPTPQKAIQGLLSRFRWSPGGLIFGRFEPGSLSTFFKNRTWKFEKSELRELKFRDFGLSKNGPETSFLDS